MRVYSSVFQKESLFSEIKLTMGAEGRAGHFGEALDSFDVAKHSFFET